jgi:lysophospholipase L1-like esterase
MRFPVVQRFFPALLFVSLFPFACGRQEPGPDARGPLLSRTPGLDDVQKRANENATSAMPRDAGLEAASESGEAKRDPLASLRGKTILHVGDSTVGGNAGLTRALKELFLESEAKKFSSETWVSASVVTVAMRPRLGLLLARVKPEIVIITLGTNDIYIPSPDMFIPHIKSIVKKIGDRECYWVGPISLSKKDTGIVETLRTNVAPCVFFDSSELEIARAGDRIHPTDKGGGEWAEAFWESMKDARVKRPEEALAPAVVNDQ